MSQLGKRILNDFKVVQESSVGEFSFAHIQDTILDKSDPHMQFKDMKIESNDSDEFLEFNSELEENEEWIVQGYLYSQGRRVDVETSFNRGDVDYISLISTNGNKIYKFIVSVNNKLYGVQVQDDYAFELKKIGKFDRDTYE